MKIAIVGAGVTGLVAGYELSRAGHEVVLYEATNTVGGLASGFRESGWDWYLDNFYHHWFSSDDAVISLIKELGQEKKLFFPRPVTAIYHEGKAYPFDSPLRALLFPHLSLVGKMRFGFTGLYLRMTGNWKPLEQYTAEEWMLKWMGRDAYEVLWKPLLEGKFGDMYREVNMAWFWARIHKRSPRLGYFAGGFQAFCNAVADRAKEHGMLIRLVSPVIRITAHLGGLSVSTMLGEEKFNRVIVTTSPITLAATVPSLPPEYLAKLEGLKYMGALVLVLSLEHRLTEGHYWINLPKSEGFPFLALVEHTNYVDRSHYGGEHIVYCGDYLDPEHEYFDLSKEELLARFLPSLSRFNPNFKEEWVRRSWLVRARYAQPVPTLNHSRNILPMTTPIPGLFWASMSQVYPWDRGTNYSVEMGREVARLVAGL